MDNKELRNKIRAAYRTEEKIIDQRFATEYAMHEEIIKALGPIVDKYAPIIEELGIKQGRAMNKIERLESVFQDYCTFPYELVADASAFLLTFVEGEPFTVASCGDLDVGDIVVRERIFDTFFWGQGVSDEDILHFYDKGDLIFVGHQYEDINFYNPSKGKPDYFFGRFGYLKEFFNRLIECRFKNERRDSISTEETFEFMSDFIINHRDLCYKNKEERELMLETRNCYAKDYLLLREFDENLEKGHKI